MPDYRVRLLDYIYDPSVPYLIDIGNCPIDRVTAVSHPDGTRTYYEPEVTLTWRVDVDVDGRALRLGWVERGIFAHDDACDCDGYACAGDIIRTAAEDAEAVGDYIDSGGYARDLAGI